MLLFPTLVEGISTREGREAFRAGCHIFYGQRVVDVRDRLRKWEGMNDESRLLDEETGEVIDGGEGGKGQGEKGGGEKGEGEKEEGGEGEGDKGGDKKRKKREGE